MGVHVRRATVDDHRRIVAVIGDWWGGRPSVPLLQPLFLEHFASTSLVAEIGSAGGGSGTGELVGFLVGFPSQDQPDEAYVHVVGVHPGHRSAGLGRRLYDLFAQQVASLGVRTMRCVICTGNEAAVRFHTAIGFGVDDHDSDGYVRMSRSVDVPQPRFVARTDARPAAPAFPRTAEVTWPIAPETTLTGTHVELCVADPHRDGAGLFEALDSDAVWAHVAGRPADPEAMAALLAARLGLEAWCPWTVRLRHPLNRLDAGAIAGTTSFLDVVPLDARGEIGATLYPESVWASAVNPECKLLLMEHAFDQLGWGRVQLKTDVRNQRSQAAIARLGARYEATLRRYQRRSDGTVRDTVVFSVIAEEWPGVRAGLRGRLGG